MQLETVQLETAMSKRAIIERASTPVSLAPAKAFPSGDWRNTSALHFRGLAASFWTIVPAQPPANIDTILLPGCFKKTLEEQSNKGIPLLYYHDDKRLPLGQVIGSETYKGYEVELFVSPTRDGEDLGQLVSDGIPLSLSIGWRPIQTTIGPYQDPDDPSTTHKVRYVRELALVEVSVCTWGADSTAKIYTIDGLPDQYRRLYKNAGPYYRRIRAERIARAAKDAVRQQRIRELLR